jgi:tetratricopeptide (TPR) repeat protein
MRGALLVALLCGPAMAEPADWTPRRDPFDPKVVARYERVLAADPFDDRALAKIDQLFAGRHTTAELEADLGDRTAAALVIRARLRARHKDPVAALALFTRAAELAPPFEARCWLAIAELSRTDAAAARTAYERALATAPPPALARAALRPLAELAVLAQDPAADTYFVQLLALSPSDPEVWLARGDALLAHDPDLATESYGQAEQFAPDMPRRLEAIVRRGDALAKAHASDAASAEYRRALALAPHGYFLIAELVAKLVDTARDQHTLPDLAARFEHDWPERTRDALEWATLGSLYGELADRPREVYALQHATALAPWDLTSQRRLINRFDEMHQRDDANKQLGAAIRAAPSEPTLQLDLARHTWPSLHALELLDRTAKQFSTNVTVLQAIAKQFTEWGHAARAERWLEQVAHLEPDDDDHWIALVDAYVAADDLQGAIKAWNRVAREMPGALLRFAAVLLDEHRPNVALGVINHSIELDGLNPEAWRLRAIAHDDLYDNRTAITDAERELSLTAPERGALHRARHHVVTLVAESRSHDDDDAITDDSFWTGYIRTWHDAFWTEPPDLDAGYLLLEAADGEGCIPALTCDELRSAAMRLERLAPDDPDVLRMEVHIFEQQGLERPAADRLRKLAILEPTSAPLIAKQLERMAKNYGLLGALYDPHVGEPADEVPGQPATFEPHAWAAGAILATATGHGDMGTSIGFGAFVDHALSDPYERPSYSSLEVRADLVQRGGSSTAGTSADVGLGLWRNFVRDSETFRLGASSHVERRFGDAAERMWDRYGLAIDLAAAVGFRSAPIDLGVRLEQWVLGGVHDTRGVLELRVRIL